MKELPILFKGALVRAILEGRKTQTRRVVKPQHCFAPSMTQGKSAWDCCPYGQPGDRLWVRETFYVQPDLWNQGHGPQPILYAASTRREEVEDYVGKPSIHMPRWASRISLEITGIRAERLQTISLDDARAEGVETTDRFAALWTDTYGAESWNADPWVWVLEFMQARKEAGI